MPPLGVRNNNPGNLEASPWTQSQPGYVSSDGRFGQFATPQDGFNALSSLLTKKFNSGLTTPRQIIGSWAPASDGNNVSAYSNNVAKAAGIGPDDALTADRLPAVASAIAQYESPGALSSSNTQPQPQTGASQMPDLGALSAASTSGGGGILNQLGGNNSGGWAGPGGVGNTLQNVGAWLQSANNPSGAASMLSQANQQRNNQQQINLQMALAGKPQLVPAGADPISGKMRFVLFNPLTGTVNTPTLGGASPASGGGSGTPGAMDAPGGSGDNLSSGDFDKFSQAFSKYQNGQATADDLTKSAPAALQQYADSLRSGTAIPNNLGMRAGALRPYALLLAHAQDPNFNEAQIPARVAVTQDLADKNNKGTLGGALASSEKIVGHLNGYLDDVQKLQQLQPLGGANNVANYLQGVGKSVSNDTDYKATVTSLNAHSDFLAGEVSNLMNGGKASVSERDYLRNLMGANKSPPEQAAAARTIAGAMKDTVDPLISKYNTAFGLTGKTTGANDPLGITTGKQGAKSTEDFWSDKTNKGFQRVMSTDPTGQFSTAPGGAAGPPAPATQGGGPQQPGGGAPAPSFSGRTATNPKTGAQLRETSDGNWVQ